MRIGRTILYMAVAALAATGCSGESGSDLDGGQGERDGSLADAGFDAGSAVDASSDARPDGSDAGRDAGQPTVSVRVVASGEPFAHADGLAGQTARMTTAGVRSLALYRSMTDPDPLVVYLAEGADAVVGYVPGDETTLGSFDASALVPGAYTFGRLVQSYARYEVDATLHRLDGSHDGVAQNFVVIADGTVVGADTYDAGHYELSFTAPDATGSWMGEDALVPVLSATSGAVGVVEAGEWAVYFPIDLVISESPAVDSMLTLTVNMDESFRWTDLLALGYRPNVFDITDISFEPVVRFGGNAFDLALSAP